MREVHAEGIRMVSETVATSSPISRSFHFTGNCWPVGDLGRVGQTGRCMQQDEEE